MRSINVLLTYLLTHTHSIDCCTWTSKVVGKTERRNCTSTYNAQRPEFAGGCRDQAEYGRQDHDGADSDRQQTRTGQDVVYRVVVSLHQQHPDAD